jgi:two-component system response regulator EvgA
VPRTVLIVDDHPSFRASARLLLEHDGFEVVGEATDGADGLAATSRLSPDVVLLDVSLPDGNGLDIAARMRTTDHGPTIILTSSREAHDFGPEVDRSGAAGFIPKDRLSGAALAALL